MNIRSRYSIQPINQNNYQTIQITSGSTSIIDPGYIFMPYVMAEQIEILDYEYISKKQKNDLRKKKLESL
jgi:hypothetical protein